MLFSVILAAIPTTTATYIMADLIGVVAELAGSIVMLSTLGAALTSNLAFALLAACEN